MAVRYKKTAGYTDQLIKMKNLGLGGTTRIYTPGGGAGGGGGGAGPTWTPTDAHDFLSWRLNEASGSTAFASSLNAGASSNLTIAETTNFRAGIDDGLFQKTVTFVGNAVSAGRFLSGGAAFPPASNKSFSMSHWMIPYSNSPAGGADPITFGKLFYANSAWANPIGGLFIALDGTSWRVYANIEGTGTYTIPASSSIPLTLNVPVLVSVTFDGNYIRLYQNGIFAGASANLNNKEIVMGNGPWFVGKAPVGFPGHSFDGQLWDVRVANTVRSASYYRTMYLTGTGTTETNLGNNVASYRYYKMVITGTKITNQSAGGVGVQFDELELLNNNARIEYTGATASVITPGAYVNLSSGIDNSLGSKWFTDANPSVGTPISYIIDFGSVRDATGFRYRTGNDQAGRDPITWSFEGSNNNSTWTVLHTQSTNATITDSRGVWTQTFAF